VRSRAGKVRLKSSPAELLASGLVLDSSFADRALDLAAVFGNRRPVEVEIGPGKGGFLLRRAQARPELNFLGIEWVRRYAWYVADRAARAGLGNLRVLCADAEAVFGRRLPPRSIWRAHIYFPDPWPKRRHQARRLIKPQFVADLRRTLRIGGWLGVVTDSARYWRQIRWVLSGQPGLAHIRADSDYLPRLVAGSNFRAKYAAAGRAFYGLAAIRYA